MSERAVAFIRKSEGSDDDVGLQLQREQVPALAEELADEVEVVDLGVHTGFSIHSRPRDAPRIDANDAVLAMVDDLEAGVIDYLVAWDDTRLARDDYFAAIERAAALGEAEIRFVADVEDGLAFGVKRQVETHIKQEEIRKSKEARAARAERGLPDGRPPFGLQYDAAGEQLIPDPEEIDDVQEIIELRDAGQSYRDISATTGVPLGTISNVLDRRERYEDFESASSHGSHHIS